MSLTLLKWYESASKDSYYNQMATTKIPRLGIIGGKFYYPDILVTAKYRLDPVTKKLTQDVKLVFQPDGLVIAQLNLPHAGLLDKYDHQIYRFKVKMDVTFIDAEVTVGVPDNSMKFQAPHIVSHAVLEGILNAHNGQLDAWGHML